MITSSSRVIKSSVVLEVFIFVCLSAASFGSVSEPTAQNKHCDLEKPGWQLTFNDEFDANSLDMKKWSIGFPGWGADCNSPNAFPIDDHGVYEIKNGVLRLINAKRDYNDGVLKHYVCGVITTASKFVQKYGWFEARCKMPGQDAAFPAFWLFPFNSTYTPGAEVDIMEHIHRRGEYTTCNMHWNGYAEDHRSIGTQYYPVPGIWTEFHTYALNWEPGVLTFYVDGDPYFTYEGPQVPSVPLWVILNNAMELWHGPIVDSALPNYFEVDYVRVYKKL